MRRTVPMRLGDIMGDWIRSCPNIARKLAEAKVPDVWPQLVGGTVASYTTSIRFERGTMYVHLSSSVARHEVFMRRAQLTEAVNRAVGVPVVRQIIVK